MFAMSNNNSKVIDHCGDENKFLSDSNKQDEKIKIINVLLLKNSVMDKLYTLYVPFSCSEIDIITGIFSKVQVLKDGLGYQLVSESTVRRAQVMTCNDPKLDYQYMINVHLPTKRPWGNEDWSKLFNNKEFSDVTLRVSGRDIYVNKQILAKKSPVFEVMFGQNTSESQNKIIEIEDVSYDTMLDMLHYIYTGKLTDDDTTDTFVKYSNLLIADDKYCVENLKETCEEKLSSMLTTENVLDCLYLTDSHSAQLLQKRAIDFVVENAEEVICAQSTQSLVNLHSHVLEKILWNLVVKMRNAK